MLVQFSSVQLRRSARSFMDNGITRTSQYSLHRPSPLDVLFSQRNFPLLPELSLRLIYFITRLRKKSKEF